MLCVCVCVCMNLCVYFCPVEADSIHGWDERESHFDVHPDESILTGNQIYHLIKLSRRVLQGWCKVDTDIQSWYVCMSAPRSAFSQ